MTTKKERRVKAALERAKEPLIKYFEEHDIDRFLFRKGDHVLSYSELDPEQKIEKMEIDIHCREIDGLGNPDPEWIPCQRQRQKLLRMLKNAELMKQEQEKPKAEQQKKSTSCSICDGRGVIWSDELNKKVSCPELTLKPKQHREALKAAAA